MANSDKVATMNRLLLFLAIISSNLIFAAHFCEAPQNGERAVCSNFQKKTSAKDVCLNLYGHLMGEDLTDSEIDLFLSACSGSTDGMMDALDGGARINARLTDGRSALHIASRHGHYMVADGLISEGANVNWVDKQGLTPLASRLKMRSCSTKDVTDLLIYHGADVCALDSEMINQLNYKSSFTLLNGLKAIGVAAFAFLTFEAEVPINFGAGLLGGIWAAIEYAQWNSNQKSIEIPANWNWDSAFTVKQAGGEPVPAWFVDRYNELHQND